MSEGKVTQHSTCRACGGSIIGVFDLGAHWPSEFPAARGEHARPRVPLNLIRCHECGLIQLEHTVPSEWMFKEHYWYRSGINEAMVSALDEVVWSAIAATALHSKMSVLDIGANDGTLLALYKKHLGGGCPVRFAYEPAPNLISELSKNADCVVQGFFPQESSGWVLGTFRAITSIACFYSNPDPLGFAREVKRLLHREGVWINQLAYLPRILENSAFDGICLLPEDLIVTRAGLRPISEITPGDWVLTRRGRYMPVRVRQERDYTGPVIKLQAYGFGHAVHLTPEHPVNVKRGTQWKWLPARRVRKGDIICRPVVKGKSTLTYLPFTSNSSHGGSTVDRLPITHNLMKVVGWYLSEGCASQGVLFYFGKGEKELGLASACRDAVEALGFKATIRTNRTSTYVQSTPTLSRLLAKEFGSGAGGKHIPAWVLELDPDLQLTLLKTYMLGDGYSYRKGAYLRGSTISQQLAYDLAMLANRVGFKASISKQGRAATCVIEGRTVNQRPLWDILVHTKPEKKLKTWMEGGLQCSRIRSISREEYAGKVYNLDVSRDHTYVAAAMTVHNCHEHLTYWSLAAMQHLLRRAGLEIYDAEEVAVNEGSIRLFITHEDAREVSPRVLKLLVAEENLHLRDTNEPYLALRAAAERVREGILQHVFATQAEGGAVDVLGASTKGNTLLQWCGLYGETIRRAIDRSPEKTGRYTVTGIPIVSEEEGRRDAARLLIALPWAFRDQLLIREAGRWPRGTKILFPMPKMEVVEL